MDLKLKTRKNHSFISVCFPKDWCDLIGLTGESDEYIQIVAYEIIRSKSVTALCTILSQDKF